MRPGRLKTGRRPGHRFSACPAFRREKMPETGAFNTINELAEHEGSASSYMTRALRLTLLAPGIVEAILEERQGAPVAHG